MKNILSGFLLGMFFLIGQQAIGQVSFSAASHTSTIDKIEYSYAVGEMILVQTIHQPGIIVTQGYYQPSSTNKVAHLDTQIGSKSAIKIYPNPTSQQLWIEVVDENSNHFGYTLTDLNGKSVYKGTQTTSSKKLCLNLSELSMGLYNLTIQLNDTFSTYKIQKIN